MDMSRLAHRVSVKIAFTNHAGDRVLLTRLHDGGYGLPGGHIEIGETPELALERELNEELGLVSKQYIDSLMRTDFWRDTRTDRILLGYSALLDQDVDLIIDEREVAGIYWASVADFDQGKVATITYEPFIRKVLSVK